MKLDWSAQSKTCIVSRYLPVGAFSVRFQLALDHVDHNVVADQTSLIHDLLGFTSQSRLLSYLSSEHVTGGLRLGSVVASDVRTL